MASINIGYFLEDIAQERFLQALVTRVAIDEDFQPVCLRHDVRNASGGRGSLLTGLRRFLRDVRREAQPPYDLLLIAMDSDCRRYTETVHEIVDMVRRAEYPGRVVCAVPDPHVERWYLADPAGLREAIGADREPQVPRHKCERALYKRALRQAFSSTGVSPPLGGAEFGEQIVQRMNLTRAAGSCRELGSFVQELRGALRRLQQTMRRG